MRVALLFIDGVGIGRRDTSTNPLARADLLLSQFDDGSGTPLPHGGQLAALDATFGVEGRPQSATNQTALYTGEPAPKLIGAHKLGYPNAALTEIIERRSIVKRLKQHGATASFVNAFPAIYFELVGKVRHFKPSASTLAFRAGDVALKLLPEGLPADIDGSRARQRGFEVPSRTAAEAAQVFWSCAADFTLFEHFAADEAAHERDAPAVERALATFDGFVRAVLETRPPDVQVLVTSDHGNAEDLSHRSHTLAKVPLLAFGAPKLPAVENVADVGRYVLQALGVGA
ncbi:MAG: alkaline phosphatase family protein [Myxococcaceae bacterium]|nr:alkaline phosphatase family protein [Myxococcaceae bacterium]